MNLPEPSSAAFHALVTVLNKDWGVSAPSGDTPTSDWETVRAALEERILELLRRNPQKLATAMYLLDIQERRFAEAMDQPTMEDRAHALSCVVMERESEKIRTRWKYSRPDSLDT